jgi:UDP-N-acetylmuramyl pentapeptide phosphotransferase/UDP-N-acetylglucosamine-1-phosphate transferase
MPKGAGIILIPAIIISISLYFFIENSINTKWLVFLLSIFFLFLISLIDDIKSLPATLRLIVHSLCVIISVYCMKDDIISFLNNMDTIAKLNISQSLLFYVFALLIIFSWLWLINLFNFMDGMDGLTALQMIFLALTINIISLMDYFDNDFQFLSLIIFSVFLAFFRYNKPPAKIFLGDSGSIPSGYIAGFVLIESLLKKGPFFSILIILMYFILDSTVTLIIRSIKNNNLFSAHSDHFYQRMIRNGHSHQYVLRKILFLLTFLILLSFISLKYHLISFSLALITTILSLIYFSIKSKNE